MRFDQICLRAMLFALAATAVLGVTAIFSSGAEVIVRLLATGGTTTLAAGLMWPLSRLMQRPETRFAGTVGIAAVLLNFLLLMIVTWGSFVFPDETGSSHRIYEFCGAVAGYLPMTAAPAVLFLAFMHQPAAWLAARLGAIAAAVAFVELTIGAWPQPVDVNAPMVEEQRIEPALPGAPKIDPDASREKKDKDRTPEAKDKEKDPETQSKEPEKPQEPPTKKNEPYYLDLPKTVNWNEAAGATSLYGFLSVLCLVGTLRQRPWRWLGLLAGLTCWVMMTMHAVRPMSTALGESVFTLASSLAILGAYANLCSLPNLAAGHEYYRWILFFFAVATTVLVDIIILHSINNPDGSGYDLRETLGRFAAASGIITSCGTLAIMVIAVIDGWRQSVEKSATKWTEMEIQCPACHREQKVALGNSTCCECGLRFSIRVSAAV